ncbi:Transglutaminase-like superfamily protein [Caloramator fervidus]|uniref:Transglutaminase-like superfamily protein n=1 Tax=Caloramator fervidus TaxID=29344 RepID=A0A1H5UVE1_9CLOT|nr:transglutaminase domain-containing protein [Caloramator fervidus]SEF78924.1 Transglutaminase-like superfamily protein [Caloramator fervidus]
MKKKIYIIFFIILLLNINVKASSNKYYNKFYSSLKDAVLYKKSVVKLYGYDYSKFNAGYVVKNVMLKYKNTKYVVSEIRIKKYKKTTYVYLNYKSAHYVANNKDELENILLSVIKSGRKNVSVKVNNYTPNYDFKTVISSLDLSTSMYFVSGFSYKIYQFKLMPSQVVVDFNFSYVNLSSYQRSGPRIIVKNEDELYRALKNGIYNLNDRIYLMFSDSIKSKGTDIIFDYIAKVLEDNGELYYIKSYGYISFDSNVVVLLEYMFNKEDLILMRNKVKEKAKSIIEDIIKPEMSDYEKVKVIHDYIIKNTKYDYLNVLNDTIPEVSHTPYGTLINGVAVCDGYATAFNMLLSMVGVESKIVFGFANGLPHAWNMVKLDGTWYHVDVTFDDPVVNGGKIDVIRYDYFIITDSQILQDHSFDMARYPRTGSVPYKHQN